MVNVIYNRIEGRRRVFDLRRCLLRSLYRLFEGAHKPQFIAAESDVLYFFIGEAPIRLQIGNRRIFYICAEFAPVILDTSRPMCGCHLTCVVAMIAVKIVQDVAHWTVFKKKTLRYVGVNVPTQQHAFIEAGDLKQVVAQR